GFFLEQRELGAINTGGPGVVNIDGKAFNIDPQGCVFAGAGTRKVTFESKDARNAAKFFLLSCPAHSSFPAASMNRDEAGGGPPRHQTRGKWAAAPKILSAGGKKELPVCEGKAGAGGGNCLDHFPTPPTKPPLRGVLLLRSRRSRSHAFHGRTGFHTSSL